MVGATTYTVVPIPEFAHARYRFAHARTLRVLHFSAFIGLVTENPGITLCKMCLKIEEATYVSPLCAVFCSGMASLEK